MSAPWLPEWFDAAAPVRRELWRGVEAQHVVATLRLVDSLHEQEVLEQLLEDSKPPLPAGAGGLHYLLFTPFRYVSPTPSRFRRAYDKGVFYGADEPATVAAELAYWRWKFVMDSEALRSREVVTEHTFFLARFEGRELDLTAPPWNAHRSRWRDRTDYSACHELASHVRERQAQVQAIRYESARRESAWCEVVFSPPTLSMPSPHRQQTWTCKATARTVLWAHGRELLEFPQA